MIPTSNEFDRLLDILHGREYGELVEQQRKLSRRFESGEVLAVSDFATFSQGCDVAWEAQVGEIRATAAFQWLDEQRGLAEAFKSMDRSAARRKKDRWDAMDWSFEGRLKVYLFEPSREEILEDMGVDFVDRLTVSGTLDGHIESRQSIPMRAHMLNHYMTRRRRRVPYEVLRPIAKAFKEYFYSDRPAELRALRAALEGIANSCKSTSLLMVATAERYPDLHNEFLVTHKLIERRAHRISRHFESRRHDFAVAQRNDVQAKERLLAYDLHYGLRRIGLRPGAAALTDLLTCEGVVNRLDARTIERHLAQWKRFDADRKVSAEDGS